MAAFYDTCALLNLGDALFGDGIEPWFCSSVSLAELEDIKTNPRKSDSTKYKARKVTRLMDEHPEQYTVIIAVKEVEAVVDEHLLPVTNDNLILACAKLSGADEVFSDDISMRQIGKHIFGLNMLSSYMVAAKPYMGYRLFSGDEDDFISYMANKEDEAWNVNEYLVFENTNTGCFLEMRFDGEKFVQLRLPPSSVVKAKTPLQRCALDMLMNDDITVAAIMGGYGSGKTFLATQMAVHNVVKRNKQEKIVGIREPRGEGKDVGFLPGTFSEKTGQFFTPLAQQMSGGQYMVDDLMRRGVLETNIPFYMKGTTYKDSILVVDEAEDLNEQQLRLVGTRLGENSRIFFSGDYEQSLLDTSKSNPLVRMCNEFKGDKKFACIYLDEDVRSETSKMFSRLFK